ncbi:LOW QUALITY PROTEIN: hypothetical protein Q4I29_005079 [Leishmania shawi]|uniref:Secreted protein n=1 Tax=Leishmania shawi TaxID=5680 RepID=A0ABR3E502_9TRYP
MCVCVCVCVWASLPPVLSSSSVRAFFSFCRSLFWWHIVLTDAAQLSASPPFQLHLLASHLLSLHTRTHAHVSADS